MTITTPLQQQISALGRCRADLQKELVKTIAKLTPDKLVCMSMTEREELESLKEDLQIDITALTDAMSILELVQKVIQLQSQFMQLS